MGRPKTLKSLTKLLRRGAEDLSDGDLVEVFRSPRAWRVLTGAEPLADYEAATSAMVFSGMLLGLKTTGGRPPDRGEVAVFQAHLNFDLRTAARRMIQIIDEHRRKRDLIDLCLKLPWLVPAAHRGYRIVVGDDVAAVLHEQGIATETDPATGKHFYALDWIFRMWETSLSGKEPKDPKWFRLVKDYGALKREAPGSEDARHVLQASAQQASARGEQRRNPYLHTVAAAHGVRSSTVTTALKRYRKLAQEADALDKFERLLGPEPSGPTHSPAPGARPLESSSAALPPMTEEELEEMYSPENLLAGIVPIPNGRGTGRRQ